METLSEASPELSRQVLSECLRDFADVRLTVTGGCMEPALREATWSPSSPRRGGGHVWETSS